MENYRNIGEKSSFFKLVRICNIDDLALRLEKLRQDAPRNFYRGIDNASYKMYSSLQRKFEERKKITPQITMPEFSNEILKKFNNSSVLMSAFRKEVASTDSDIAKWAFIQHFSGPSHLVDFTDSVESALFFATGEGKTSMDYNEDVEDLENYISLYALPDLSFFTSNFNDMSEIDSEKGFEWAAELLAMEPGISLSVQNEKEKILTQPLEPAHWGSSVYGDKPANITMPDNGEQKTVDYSNLHIRKQGGNFFAGKIDEVIPLEKSPRWHAQNGPIATCIDIHKSLIPAIHEKFTIPERSAIYTCDEYLREAKQELSELWRPKETQTQ